MCAITVYYIFCIVRVCQPLNKISRTPPIIKAYGDDLTVRCSSHSCTKTAGNVYDSFTKLNKTSRKLEPIHQGNTFSKTVTNFTDSGIYCCAPHCANNTESCCFNIAGIIAKYNYMHVTCIANYLIV